MSCLRGLVLHAERLERDDVWAAVSDALGALERRDGRATLFVHPCSAIVAGADLGDRIRALLGRGHEVAQHTHFYASGLYVGRPADDLSEVNVLACLERDRDYLLRSGADPRGFTAGAWRESGSPQDGWKRQDFATTAPGGPSRCITPRPVWIPRQPDRASASTAAFSTCQPPPRSPTPHGGSEGASSRSPYPARTPTSCRTSTTTISYGRSTGWPGGSSSRCSAAPGSRHESSRTAPRRSRHRERRR